jgi:ankyrin repeat protein
LREHRYSHSPPPLPQTSGSTALHLAAQNGWIEGAQALLRAGARTNITNKVWRLASA